ncbi:MAG: MjaI family restriction endonuclease, partial [Ignavibacteriales bacterium]|nr:MjaI family restriction endonuclease [Ignavibacteriales bacterium]
KYAAQLLNLANQNAQGTRPRVVGQMSELIQQFSGKTIEEWERWYPERHPDALDEAATKIKAMIANLREALEKIDDETVDAWFAIW